MMHKLMEWARSNGDLIVILSVGSILLFVGTLIFIPWMIVRLPADYFMQERHRPENVPFFLYIFLQILKNILGALFVLAGVAMLVLPGQGILTILIGLSLTDFPGKRDLELKLIKKPSVYKAINWMRRKYKKPPLQIPRRCTEE